MIFNTIKNLTSKQSQFTVEKFHINFNIKDVNIIIITFQQNSSIRMSLYFPRYSYYIKTSSVFTQLILLTAIFFVTLKIILRKDTPQKVLALSSAFAFTTYLALDYEISYFLFNVIILQLLGMAMFCIIGFPNSNVQLLCISLTNIYGIAHAYEQGYFKMVFVDDWQNLQNMIAIVFLGFFSIIVLNMVIKALKVKVLYQRKLFHIVPAIVMPILAKIDFGLFITMSLGAFYIFFHLQILRYYNCLQANSSSLSQWMGSFNQSREKYFWFTHLFLYLGLILPYLYFGPHDLRAANISVILCLGDAMAAIIGSELGRNKFPFQNRKTIQGFLGFVVTLIVLEYYYMGPSLNMKFVLASSIICGLVEVYSGDADNFMIPMAYITLYQLDKRYSYLH